MSIRTRLLLVLTLALVGAGLSGMLLLEHRGESLGTGGLAQICGEGAQSGCDTVSRSAYSEVLGIPWGAVGLVFYLSIAALVTLSLLGGGETREAPSLIALICVATGLAIDLGLLGIQALAIHAFCKACLLTYAVNGAAFWLLLPARRFGGVLQDNLKQPAGRLVLGGWVLASLALAFAAAGADRTLIYRARQREASLLGTPNPAPAPQPQPTVAAPNPSPAASPLASPAGRLDAQQEAKRLQEILDDPKKLEQYFAEKAAREFEHAKVQNIDLNGVPYKGPAGAPVRAVVYSDFLCPWCRSLAQALENYLPQSGNKVVVSFKNYPLDKNCNSALKQSTHSGACWMALGGICAHEQGRFWTYHDKVFSTTLENPEARDVLRLGEQVGLDRNALEACLASPKTKERLDADIAEGHRVGVEGTPAVFLNGKKLPRINDFVVTVDKEAARAASGQR